LLSAPKNYCRKACVDWKPMSNAKFAFAKAIYCHVTGSVMHAVRRWFVGSCRSHGGVCTQWLTCSAEQESHTSHFQVLCKTCD
jgi:hypothetical protein